MMIVLTKNRRARKVSGCISLRVTLITGPATPQMTTVTSMARQARRRFLSIKLILTVKYHALVS